MRVVVLMKAIRWQPFAGDRFFAVLEQGGIDVVGVICQRERLRSRLQRLGLNTQSGRRAIWKKLKERVPTVMHRGRETEPAQHGQSRKPFPRLDVDSHNSDECRAALRELQPDVVLVRGTDIIESATIDAVPLMLNVHYGALPGIRGMHAIQWSLLLGQPPMLTLHRVDHGVDTGPILMRRRLDISGAESIVDLKMRADRMAPELFRDGCLAVATPPVHWEPNAQESGRQYYRMHPFLLHVAHQRLALMRSQA